MVTLRTESIQFLSRSDGKGSGARFANRENRPDQNSENHDGQQPNLKEQNRSQTQSRAQKRSREELLRMWADKLRGWVESGKLSEADARAKYEWAEKGSDADVEKAVGDDKDDSSRGKEEYEGK